jgi:exodeoxyribonuclease V
VIWSPQQERALGAVSAWLRSPKGRPVFRLFGYAGTGKTTLAKAIAENTKGRVCFGAFTGKAAHVLRKKGCAGASTIHSMIYTFEEDGLAGQPRFELNRDADVKNAALIIIDEVSMVDETLARDLMSFGVPILCLGDPAQLPPVNGEGWFINAQPDVVLTEIHRQALESPILRIATDVRQGRHLVIGDMGGARVVKWADLDPAVAPAADQVLVGLNRTRQVVNRQLRALAGRQEGTPELGDKIVVLRNDREKRIFNGSLWLVDKIDLQTKADKIINSTRLTLAPEDGGKHRVDICVRNEFWTGDEGALDYESKRGTQEATFGYALTVHKAQGSEWSNVVLFDESKAFRGDARRWLYTGITRASENLTVVV